MMDEKRPNRMIAWCGVRWAVILLADRDISKAEDHWGTEPPEHAMAVQRYSPTQFKPGLYLWEGRVTAHLDGVRWRGEYRRLTPAEALVLAAGGNPLEEALDDAVNEAVAARGLIAERSGA